MRIRTFRVTGLWILISLLALPSFGAVCTRGNRPAATLLLPYFEVDTVSASGRTTLFSIGNSSDEATAAYVTVWTDWSIPVLGFFVHLNSDEVQTINLRDVLRDLQIPSLDDADPERFPGCAAASQAPAVTAEQLRQRLRGLPDAETGRCYGSDRNASSLAVGFVTVDVAADCVADLDSPRQWVSDALAGNSNILFGEIFYVDTDQDSAQGRNMVPVRHDPSVEVDRFFDFYPSDLSRVPPDERWRTRFLQGLGVDADTELVIWMAEFDGLDWTDGLMCDSGFPNQIEYHYRTGLESGPLAETFQAVVSPATARKIPIETLLPDGAGDLSGVLEIESWSTCGPCVITPEPPIRLPSVAWPIVRADGRFSLAVEATAIEGSCIVGE